MINAKEAKKMTTDYISELVEKHIHTIEGTVKEYASKGRNYTYYANGLHNADPRVKAGVLAVLQEAGYKARWGETQLCISWEEA